MTSFLRNCPSNFLSEKSQTSGALAVQLFDRSLSMEFECIPINRSIIRRSRIAFGGHSEGITIRGMCYMT
jgi:hypothetical protein